MLFIDLVEEEIITNEKQKLCLVLLIDLFYILIFHIVMNYEQEC